MKKTLLAVIFAVCANMAIGANDKIIVAYVGSSENSELPDPFKMTHINYAFGVVNDTFDGVRIQNPARLRLIAELKQQNPKLKVMLSIGGWGAGGFSEMAFDGERRAKFVANCGNIVSDFGIDGIDLDWEYPSSSSAGIKSSPEDVANFTSLVRELRAVLGADNLLTFASASTAEYVDFVAVEPYLDFVNLMTYDMERPPHGGHHSALYCSDNAKTSVEKSVKLHIAAGLPKNKIVVGIPFYAHGNTAKSYSDFENYTEIERVFAGHKFLWDDVSKVPYVAHRDDNSILCVYDNERSIAIKCDYIYDNDLRGAMYWVYGADGAKGPLRDAVYNGINR